jgi:outer membrane biosynthesis protein TonB
MDNTVVLDAKNKQRGVSTSIGVHLLLLLMAFFYYFHNTLPDPDPDKPYKIDLDFQMVKEIKHNPPKKFQDFDESTSNSTKSNADKGESRPLNPEVQKVEQNDPKPPAPTPDVKPTPAPVPTPTPPAPANTPVSSKVEDTPVKVKETPKPVESPKTTPAPRPAESTKPAPPVSNPTPAPTRVPPTAPPTDKPGAGTVGSTTGTGDKPQSTTDGDGRGKSDSGPGRGSDKGPDVTSGYGNSSDGTGEFDGTGNGIFNRRVIYRNVGALPMTVSGRVVVKTCINRDGNITYTEILPETTIKDRAVLKKVLLAVKGYKYAPDKSADKEQCGKLSVTLDINAFKLK